MDRPGHKLGVVAGVLVPRLAVFVLPPCPQKGVGRVIGHWIAALFASIIHMPPGKGGGVLKFGPHLCFAIERAAAKALVAS
eukprot:CAMPEP_0204040342 /NCGR_PEP_ID=MMETSP0360-20130528/91982_1 /ASSEMBLY_ACC=CAM_ASM_000342 /TAXON_ID=268821 /ORGANISM="Scrippsiella Hangoei, Strain SHTV-5" /LENGTH=80 /DNA_ID=CAMNT_0050986353 /DNA_START=230 /DNA_END=470 /DNA_ORIENTATION=-